jgi:hypothetical protein
VRLGHGDEQRVKLVEERRVRRQMGLEQPAGLFVPHAARQHAVTRQHAADVRVRHEHGAPGGVEQDRVHGLGSEPGHHQQLATQRYQRRQTQPGEPSTEPPQEPSCERVKPPRLHAMEASGPDHFRERAVADTGEAMRTEQPPPTQRRHGARRGRPGRMLGQHRADGDLIGRAPRPPVLRPEAPLERDIGPQQLRLDRIRRRSRNPSPAEDA